MDKIEKMRRIDQGVGIPLCFMLTLADRLIQKICSKNFLKSRRPLQKILFLKPAEMGTSVILYPTLEEAKKMFPDAELYFVAFEENVPIFEVLQVIPKTNIFKIRTSSFFKLSMDTLKIIRSLRKIGIDTVIDLEFFSRYTAVFSYLTGAERRVGFHRFNAEGLYRGELMTHKVSYNYYLHVGLSFMSLLYALKYPPGRIPLQEPLTTDLLKIPQIELSESARVHIYEKLRRENGDLKEDSKIVILSPNTGEWLPYRKWPIGSYAELAERLLAKREDLFIVICGTSSAAEDGNYLKEIVKNPRLINLVGKTTLSEFIDLLNISKVIVSVDSGPAHFAALTQAGIVCIFGPDTKEIFAPLSPRAVCLESDLACHPCFSVFNARRPNCSDKVKPCLKSTSADQILCEVEKFIEIQNHPLTFSPH